MVLKNATEVLTLKSSMKRKQLIMKNIILVSFLVSFLALQYISAAQEIKDINENNNLFWNPEAFYNPAFTGINGNSISFNTQFWKWGNRTSVIQHYNAELLSKNQKNAFGLASSQISNDNYRSVNYSASFSRILK